MVPLQSCSLVGFSSETVCNSTRLALILLMYILKKLDRICQIWSLCASRSADLHGILLSQSNIKSLSEKGDFEVGLPRLSGRISSYEAVPPCVFLWISELCGLLEAEFMIMLLGRRCPKLFSFVLPNNLQT